MSKSPLAKEVTFAACWPDRRWSATHTDAKGVPCGSAPLTTGVARYWRTLGRCRTMHFDAAGHKGGAVQHMIRATCPIEVAGSDRDPEQTLVSGLESCMRRRGSLWRLPRECAVWWRRPRPVRVRAVVSSHCVTVWSDAIWRGYCLRLHARQRCRRTEAS